MKKESKKVKEAALPLEDKLPEKTAQSAEVSGLKVGEILRRCREEQDKKIADISKSLCIRKVYLQAIEASDYEEIPAFPYGPGFIRSYADFLGLDGVALVQMFKEETEADKRNEEKVFVPEPQNEAALPGKKYLLISLLALILIYALWYWFNNRTPDSVMDELPPAAIVETQSTIGNDDFPLVVEDFAQVEDASSQEEPLTVIDTTKEQPVDGTQVTVTDASFSDKQNVEKPADEFNKTVKSRAEIRVNTKTWIEVSTKDKIYISKELNPGEVYVLPEDKGLRLSTGNAGGFEIWVDGKALPVVGTLGSVKKNVSLDKVLDRAEH